MKVVNQVQLLLLQPVVGLESFLNDYNDRDQETDVHIVAEQ